MTIDRIFLAFMAVVGAAIGFLLVLHPPIRNFVIPPYLWVIVAMMLFEAAAYWRGGGAAGTMVSMEYRLIALVVAVALVIAIPSLMGSPGRVLF
jgi:hypothetical protein